MLAALGSGTYDLLVIGGGITGAGVAREASLRGLRVALVERGDFGSGTSSRSTKLIHGGLRYLKALDLRLVRESVHERMRLLAMAPHLVRVRQFLFPIYDSDSDSLLTLRLGLTLYDWFAGRHNPIPHKMASPSEVAALEPLVRRSGLTGGGVYCDATTDDARLTLAVLRSALHHGAIACSYTRVESFMYGGGGQVCGVRVRDLLTGKEAEVRAAVVLAAAGPWADQLRRLDNPAALPLLRLTKGTHVAVAHERLPISAPVVMRGGDGRMMFAVPAGEFCYLGTTDTDCEGDPAAAMAEPADVAYILAAAQRTFPESRIGPQEIISSWAGVRPLIRPDRRMSPTAISRDYRLHRDPSGLISVIGGKLTAFRAMAAAIVDRLFPATRSPAHLRSSAAPLPGAGPGLASAELALLAAHTGVTLPYVGALSERYGADFADLVTEVSVKGTSELIWLRAQLRHAVRREMARRLEDVYARRTGILLFRRGNGREYVAELAREMGQLLSWSEAQISAEKRRTHAVIDAMFAWRSAESPLRFPTRP